MADAAAPKKGLLSGLFNKIVQVGVVVAAAIMMEPLILYLFHTMTGGMILQTSLTPILENLTNALGVNDLFTHIGNWIAQFTLPSMPTVANTAQAAIVGGGGSAYAFN